MRNVIDCYFCDYYRIMGFLHMIMKCLIFLLGTTEIVGTTCDPPPSSTITTSIVGTAHEGRASVSAGESFSYTCTTWRSFDWQPICPNSVYPPNVLEEYTITCLGNNQWDYVSEGCCPTESGKYNLHGMRVEYKRLSLSVSLYSLWLLEWLNT